MKITQDTKSGGFETRPYIFLRPLRSLRLHYFFFVLFIVKPEPKKYHEVEIPLFVAWRFAGIAPTLKRGSW